MNAKLFLLLLIMTHFASCGQPETTAPPTGGSAPAHPATPAPANPGAAATTIAPGDEILDQISFHELPLDEAIRQLAKMARVSIGFDPALLNRKSADGTPVPLPSVKEDWRHVTARQSLQALLYNYGWQMELTRDLVPNERDVIIEPDVIIHARKSNSDDPLITKVNLSEKSQPAGNPAPAQDHAASGDEILEMVHFDEEPLQDAIRQLAKLADINIQLDPRLANSLDAKGRPIPAPMLNKNLKNVSARQALLGLLDEYGWQATRIAGNPILRIEVKDPRVPDSANLPALKDTLPALPR